MEINKIDYVPFKCSKCGREIPRDRECPTCAAGWPLGAIALALVVVSLFIIGIVAAVRSRPKPVTFARWQIDIPARWNGKCLMVSDGKIEPTDCVR